MFDKIQEAVGLRKKPRLFIDTNALLLLGSKGLDVLTESLRIIPDAVLPVVLDKTIDELLKIAEGKTGAKGKDKFNAKLGFIFVKQKGLKVLKSSPKDNLADDAIVRLSKEGDYVLTLDRALQKRLMKNNVRILSVRQNRLVFVESR